MALPKKPYLWLLETPTPMHLEIFILAATNNSYVYAGYVRDDTNHRLTLKFKEIFSRGADPNYCTYMPLDSGCGYDATILKVTVTVYNNGMTSVYGSDTCRMDVNLWS